MVIRHLIASLALLTRLPGFIASYVADTLLKHEYRVRGTARSLEKLAALQALFDNKYGVGRFESAVVADMAVDGAFDTAMRGVAGVAHVASIMPNQADPASLSNPELVIGPVVAGTLSVLKTAAATPSVKRVVLTSSSSAAIWPHPNVESEAGEDTWNTECIEQAATLAADAPGKEWYIYGASKVRGEQAAWKFYNEEKPGFVFNSILPNINLGPPLIKEDARSTGAWVAQAYNGDLSGISVFAPRECLKLFLVYFHHTNQPMAIEWFVDVRDTALLHYYALTGASPASPELRAGGVRMWAVAAPFSGNDILASLRRLYPGKTFPDELKDMGKELCKIDNRRGEELLKLARGSGWRSLDESVKASVDAELA